MRRAIIIVLDSLGIGAMPDAKDYGDEGSNTLGHIAEVNPDLTLPNLEKLGLGNIAKFKNINPADEPLASYGKMAELSVGKDTTTGHWEMMGIVLEKPFPTYPKGFPPEVISKIEEKIGSKTLGNYPQSGTEIIEELGEEHLATKRPIVYTSADSVLQIAAHEDIIPLARLYEICETVRKIMVEPNNVGRVIARPFKGKLGSFYRTENRKDYSIKPPYETLLSKADQQGLDVVAIGKIYDVFAGVGINKRMPGKNNEKVQEAILKAMMANDQKESIIFANLVDFDSLYGHRNDPIGYAEALMTFDNFLAKVLLLLQKDDMLIITADHGCDPTMPGTDHTREYVPLLIYGYNIKNINLGIRESFSDLGATVAAYFDLAKLANGKSMWPEPLKFSHN